MENEKKQVFEENYKKQAKLLKKQMLCILCGIGAAFTVAAIILFCINAGKEMPIVFISIGLFMIVAGMVFYFAIPTKCNYEKYRSKVEKYGLMNIYEMNAKIIELEKRKRCFDCILFIKRTRRLMR